MLAFGQLSAAALRTGLARLQRKRPGQATGLALPHGSAPQQPQSHGQVPEAEPLPGSAQACWMACGLPLELAQQLGWALGSPFNPEFGQVQGLGRQHGPVPLNSPEYGPQAALGVQLGADQAQRPSPGMR